MAGWTTASCNISSKRPRACCDDIAVARPPRELGVTVDGDVEVVLPELRHHLQHRSWRDEPSHQKPTPVVVHHPIAGAGARTCASTAPSAPGAGVATSRPASRPRRRRRWTTGRRTRPERRRPHAPGQQARASARRRTSRPGGGRAREATAWPAAARRVVGCVRGWGKARRARCYRGTGPGDQRPARGCHRHSQHLPHDRLRTDRHGASLGTKSQRPGGPRSPRFPCPVRVTRGRTRGVRGRAGEDLVEALVHVLEPAALGDHAGAPGRAGRSSPRGRCGCRRGSR